MTATAEQLLPWLQFWQQPWQLMHDSWVAVSIPASLHGPGRGQAHPLWQHLDATQLRQMFDLTDEAPSMPGDVLLQWVVLSNEQRRQVLNLAAEVAVRQSGAHGISPADVSWCRHLAKALMPGNWSVAQHPHLPGEQVGLALLQQWMSVATWSRARLCFPSDWVLSLQHLGLEPVPANRLNQLWHAVMWRIANSQAEEVGNGG
ncbi:hypothetical protein C4K68_11385 [Pokkaliibacter plantistimulans]|uniref:Type III secretion protein n=1 Tax=Proteobacteria bacterium 228 TaxID=2083153 RepID=A0A2S5KQA3_9PROT|nr:hypothetical protein [Pokkaliibacter plantistimulans]PPC77024.1 hypothetical protein C4K68_11385 [Pokkaliibacter plantistimulans]